MEDMKQRLRKVLVLYLIASVLTSPTGALRLFFILFVKTPIAAMKAVVRRIFPALYCKDLTSEVVLVTGAASGMGRKLATKFVQSGSQVIICDVNEEALRAAEKDLQALSSKKVLAYKVNLSDKTAIAGFTKQVKQDLGSVHVSMLINNAGIVTGKTLLECSDEEIERTMNVNTMAHFWLIRAFLPEMLERQKGHIVTVASVAGTIGAKNLVDYCASKFAAFGLDEALRWELKDTPIQTTCICPYFVQTGMFSGVQSKWPRLLPMLKEDYAVYRVFLAIQTNQPILVFPSLCHVTGVLRSLMPNDVMDELASWFGANSAMDTFVGRKGS